MGRWFYSLSHDKGRTKCEVEVAGDKTITVQTLHTVPFRRYHIPLDSQEAKTVLADMSSKLLSSETGIIQSDFNLDTVSLKNYFPELFELGWQETLEEEATTPKGHHYDHILYKGLHVADSVLVKDVQTDHYPIVSTFELDL